jgi:hypothetical protein
MGLRVLDPADWLEPDRHRDDELAQKDELLRTRFGDVVATLPIGDEASVEACELVVADAERLGLIGGRERDLLDRFGSGELHAIDLAGRLVQEDVCVMVRDAAGSWVLGAASVCFPSRWVLAEKIGRSITDIHAPVPDYDRIAAPTEIFFDRLTVDRPVWRTNWTVVEDPSLHLGPGYGPVPAVESAFGTAIEATGAYLRVERQTLRRLPRTGAVVFTIRTYVDPVEALSPRARADLGATLEHAGSALIDYREWAELLPRLLPRLRGPGDLRGGDGSDVS